MTARRRTRRAGVPLAAVVILSLLTACAEAPAISTTSDSGTTATSAPTGEISISPDDPQAFTPILAHVPVAPVPFAGSDGKTHVVYELFITNTAPAAATLDQVEVIDSATGEVVDTLDEAALVDAFEVVTRTTADGVVGAAQSGTIYLHLLFDDAASVPESLGHRLSATLPDAPPERQKIDESVATVRVDDREVVELGPPLEGTGYLAADGCCDSTRHRRAALPVNGSLTIAQRYAIDWEQVDDEGRIYVGERTDPNSYAIYGDEALAVAEGTVVKVLDGFEEQVPGTFPENISIEEADGNSVVIDLGAGNFVMYAHLQPGSPRVEVGDKVEPGDVIGLVGNSGNSIAPHLHLHLMDSPLPLASSGLPYTIDDFTISGQTVSTEAFDKAEADGTPLEYTPVDPPTSHRDQYPMDQSLVTF